MHTARIQFDWQHHKPPEPMSFGFFFEPILPRLARCYWICDDWPLKYPMSELAQCALAMVEDDVAPPNTILTTLAHEIIGDRDDFYGVLHKPSSARKFDDAYRRAGAADEEVWQRIRTAGTGRKAYERDHERYLNHVREHSTQADRFLDAYPVEFAFVTNDSVWWFGARERVVIDEIVMYAKSVPGMTADETLSLGL